MKKTKFKENLSRAIKKIGNGSKIRGITLISFVITIIILLILATITIVELRNTNLFNKTIEARNKYKTSAEEENNTLDDYANKVNDFAGGIAKNNATKTTIATSDTAEVVGNLNPINAKDWIGKKVKYKDDNNWEILYIGDKFSGDNTKHIYLISTINRGNQTLNTNNDYKSTIMYNSTNDRETSKYHASNILSFYNTYKTSTTTGVYYAWYMLNPNNWVEYFDSTYADYAVGGVTEDIFLESFNLYNGVEVINNSNGEYVSGNGYMYTRNEIDYNSRGYLYSRKGVGSFSNLNTFYKDEFLNNTPYYRGFNYWVASPDGGYSNTMRSIYDEDYNFAFYGYTSNGIRPMISLKSNIILKLNNDDGTFELQ